LGGSGKRSLPMVRPFAIGRAFGLAAATRLGSLHRTRLKEMGRTQRVWRLGGSGKRMLADGVRMQPNTIGKLRRLRLPLPPVVIPQIVRTRCPVPVLPFLLPPDLPQLLHRPVQAALDPPLVHR